MRFQSFGPAWIANVLESLAEKGFEKGSGFNGPNDLRIRGYILDSLRFEAAHVKLAAQFWEEVFFDSGP